MLQMVILSLMLRLYPEYQVLEQNFQYLMHRTHYLIHIKLQQRVEVLVLQQQQYSLLTVLVLTLVLQTHQSLRYLQKS